MAKRRRSPVENPWVEPAMCSTELKREILRALPFLSSLDDRQIASIDSRFRHRGFAPGEMICLSHSPATHLYVVAAGLVKLLDITEEGRSVILDLLGRGEFFGYSPGAGRSSYGSSAQALTSTCALACSKASFQSILSEYPAVGLDLLDIVSARLEQAQQTIRRLTVDPAEKRVARTLLLLGEKFGQQELVGLLIQLPLSREDLADMSGTTTETASRVVSELRRDSLIKTGRRWIAIQDLDALTCIAGSE